MGADVGSSKVDLTLSKYLLQIPPRHSFCASPKQSPPPYYPSTMSAEEDLIDYSLVIHNNLTNRDQWSRKERRPDRYWWKDRRQGQRQLCRHPFNRFQRFPAQGRVAPSHHRLRFRTSFGGPTKVYSTSSSQHRHSVPSQVWSR